MSAVRRPPVAILRAEPGVLPGLGVARTLGRIGVPVALMSASAGAAAGRSRYVVARSSWRPSEDPAGAIETLRRT
ncbi:MAG: hypothetical protein ACM3OO_12395, partial [Planctomycetaceae bacterium]